MNINIKKTAFNFIIIPILISSCYMLLNKEVSIQQGVNYKTQTIKMPLHMKLTDFFARSNHYKLLVKKIVALCKTDREKMEALFKWTVHNIRPVPKGFPVIDDHVDNIIIRGYGTDDQSSDVFTTLLSFAGFKGGIYLTKIYPDNYIHALSVVEHNKRFLLFDPYYNLFFVNQKGLIASLDDIKKDLSIVNKVAGNFKIKNKYNYTNFFKNLIPINKIEWSKADLQIPSKRIIYIIGRMLHLVAPSNTFYGESYL